MKTCSIEGCARTFYAKGWCQVHWRRWRESGDPGPAEIQVHIKGRTCLVDNCDTRAWARDLCAVHYRQWIKTQDREPCNVDGCDRPSKTKGLCNSHYERKRKGSTLTCTIGERFGEDSSRWAGDEIAYFGFHTRLQKTKGPAANHPCQHCDGQARQWAYDHTDPNEKIDRNSGLTYSVDLDRYIPLCPSCHKLFDLGIK